MSFLRAIFFLSGAAGLGYQILWTGQLAVGMGHEMPSLLAVVTAFFAGLALGAWALDRPIARSACPGRWYALLELFIGAWAMVLLVLLPWLNLTVARLIGIDPSPARHWFFAFTLPLLALLPATAAMGATLPAMDRFVARLEGRGRQVGGLYAANTLGAAAGLLISTFVLIPSLGFRASVMVLAGVNVLCAAAVLLGPARGESARPEAESAMSRASGEVRLLATIFLTGLLGIGYEVLAVRVMAQVLQNTVYSYASALAVYLLATAAGAALYQARARRADFEGLLTWLVQAIGLSCLLGTVVLRFAPDLYAWARGAFGRNLGGSIAAEMLLALAVFLLPSLCMGATFSHLAQAARRRHGGVGRALGLNTLGGAVAPPLFGVVLLPQIGARPTLLIVGAAYFALMARLTPVRRLIPAALAVILIPAVLGGDLHLVEGIAGGRIVDYREGVMAAVAIVDDPQGDLYLKVNNHFTMGATKRSFAERRQAHLPLLLHPEPRRALFLGVGTGTTAGAAAAHPGLYVEAVELLPEVIDLAGYFERVNRSYTALENVRVHVADARRHVRVTDETFDVIVADLFHPARDGSGWLYTVEHFQAIKARLAPGGLFCQWLPLYQLDEPMCRLIVRTFLAVFPHARAFMAQYNAEMPILGLMGSVEPLEYRTDWFATRVGKGPLARALVEQQQALYDDFALFGCFVCGRDELVRFGGGERLLNTDDRPLLRFQAPRHAYAGEPEPFGRMALLIDEYGGDPAELFGRGEAAAADAAFVERLRRFIEARNLYLHASNAHSRQDLRTAVAGYLESVAASPDFPTAYLVLLEMARHSSDPDAARSILRSLERARPERPEAAALLRAMPGRG